jgi:hypothetical protein
MITRKSLMSQFQLDLHLIKEINKRKFRLEKKKLSKCFKKKNCYKTKLANQFQ